MFEAGFVREGGEAYSPTAVRWWLMYGHEDGFFFARGGRVSSDQAAQSELAGARTVLGREREAWRQRATHELLGSTLVRRFSHELWQDGTLKSLTPTDFEVADTPRADTPRRTMAEWWRGLYIDDVCPSRQEISELDEACVQETDV